MAMNQQQLISQDKKRQTKLAIPKNNNPMRFNIGQEQLQLIENMHHNIPMSSNAVLQQENWDEHPNQSLNEAGMIPNQYKMAGNKMGAATSINFMKNGQQVSGQQFNMQMLRSVQQNMPNMPNVSGKISSILT